MKQIIFIALVAVVLGGCSEQKQGASRSQGVSRSQEAPQERHQMKRGFALHNKAYEYHDPDCALCRERRKQEVIAIVDSMIQIVE